MTAPQLSTQAQRPDLTIVIPAYREERRIGTTLDELARFLRYDRFFESRLIEVLVVAADAPDRTREIVLAKRELFTGQQVPFHLLEPGPRVGKGRDVQYGMLRAQGRCVVYMDADLATPLHHLKRFYSASENGADVAVGTRDLFRYRPSKFRNLFSGYGNQLYQLISGVHVEDTQCGFKMFRYDAAQRCFGQLTILGWGFDMEVLAIARANGLSVQSIRLEDWRNKPYSTYTDKPIRIAWQFALDFVKIQVRYVSGLYKVGE